MSSSFSTFELIFLILYCLYCWCFLTPLIFYYVHRFYSLRRTPTIYKRHYRIVIVINIAISIYIIFSRPSLMIAALNGSSRADNCFKTRQHCSIWQTISDISDAISSHGWPILLVIRVWLIYFQTTYNDQYCRGQWTQFIDPKSIELQTNSWTFRTRNTLGKEQWVIRYVFGTYYAFSLCVGLLLIILFPQHKLDPVLKAPVLILFITLWYKTPKHTDVLKLRREMKLMLSIVGVDIVCFVVYSILLTYIANEEYRIYCICVFQTWFATAHALYALCSTKWVLTYSGLHVPSMDQLLSYIHTDGIQKDDAPKIQSLTDILSKQESLHIFMRYLCSEWSMESLLCIIECYQFKEFAKSNGYGTEESVLKVLSLPTDTLPQSVIVYDSKLSLKEKFQKIVDKYIREGSAFQVNVGYDVRYGLESLCPAEKTDIDYYQCFDDVLYELFYLMQDSYFRFINAGGLDISTLRSSSVSTSESPQVSTP